MESFDLLSSNLKHTYQKIVSITKNPKDINFDELKDAVNEFTSLLDRGYYIGPKALEAVTLFCRGIQYDIGKDKPTPLKDFLSFLESYAIERKKRLQYN